MSEIVQVKYTGSTPGADSNEYTLFDSTVAFSAARQAAMCGLNKLTLSLYPAAGGSLQLYSSPDRGTTWHAIGSADAVIAASGDLFEYVIESMPDFKLVFTNAGVAQTGWEVDLALVSQRAGV